MAFKSLDQPAAWILSLMISGLGFTGIYFGLNYVAAKNSKIPEGAVAESDGGQNKGEHVETDAHGSGHDEPPASDDGHSKSEVKKPSNEESDHDGTGHEVAGHDSTPTKADHSKPKVASNSDQNSMPGSLTQGLCASGRSQSPVDIDAAKNNPDLKPIQFNYKIADVIVKNTGHSIQTDFPPGNWISFNGDRYDLLQFNFHVPSEHRVGGSQYEMEVQLVHKNAHSDIAIVSVFFSNGNESAIIAPVWSATPKTKGKVEKPIKFNPSLLLPKARKYVNYSGSLTMPPCTEGVAWIVFEQPLTASAAQLDAPMKLHGYNARSVQPLFGRELSRMAK